MTDWSALNKAMKAMYGVPTHRLLHDMIDISEMKFFMKTSDRRHYRRLRRRGIDCKFLRYTTERSRSVAEFKKPLELVFDYEGCP
jgi:hypothetical protein